LSCRARGSQFNRGHVAGIVALEQRLQLARKGSNLATHVAASAAVRWYRRRHPLRKCRQTEFKDTLLREFAQLPRS
jgi:hypothetical protein